MPAIVYGGMARSKSMDSTGDTLVLSPCDTVTATDSVEDKF